MTGHKEEYLVCDSCKQKFLKKFKRTKEEMKKLKELYLVDSIDEVVCPTCIAMRYFG